MLVAYKNPVFCPSLCEDSRVHCSPGSCYYSVIPTPWRLEPRGVGAGAEEEEEGGKAANLRMDPAGAAAYLPLLPSSGNRGGSVGGRGTETSES